MFRNKILNFLLVVGISIFIILSISFYTKPVYVYNDLPEEDVKVRLNKQVKVPSDDKQDSNVKPMIKPKLKENPKLKRILYWNELYGRTNYGFCCGRGPYKKNNCANDACYTSKDRTGDLSMFDAIVFHGRNINKNDLPPKR